MTNLLDWKSSLLRARGLHAPDGRPLYAYRLNVDESESLEALLKSVLQSGAHHSIPLNIISERFAGFRALFVLYAAEWWRQRYDGSGFSWGPILQDLGGDPGDWNQVQRSQCVMRGLQDWQLSLCETAGLRYIGTIALQGGLPMRLLAAAKGGLGRLLRSVLKEAIKVQVTSVDIQNWVRSVDYYLPRTYRQPEIHILLAEVIMTVLRLREEAGLTQSAGAVAELEKNVPGWRERFPLPIGDKDAQGLIEQLIRDAATIKVERRIRPFLVERYLDVEETGVWQLRSSLPLPEIVEVASLSDIFGVNSAELPRFLELTLRAGDADYIISIRKMAGQDKYRVERRPCDFFAAYATAEHVLQLSAADGRVWTSSAPRGEALNEKLPWVFDARNESLKFVRQGSGSVTSNEALVVLPDGWIPSPDCKGSIVQAGCLETLERKVFRVSGDAHFSCREMECRIRTGRADANNESYEWHGKRLWQTVVHPPMAFLGKPYIYKVDEEGCLQAVTGEPGWRPLGGNRAGLKEPLGPVEMWYPATGEVKQRANMLILPSVARIHLEFHDATAGRIRLERWGAKCLQIDHPDMSATTHCEGDDLVISLKQTGSARMPEWLEADVYWHHSVHPARVRVPLPLRGARVFAANGKELPSGILLAANQLLGVRVICLGGNPSNMPRMRIEFRLLRKGMEVSIPVVAPNDSAIAEVRLQDFVSEIAQLLANDESPDAQIEVVVHIGNDSSTRLRIARYACRLERTNVSLLLEEGELRNLSPEDLLELPVMALYLGAPGEEPEKLHSMTSEGVPTGAWAFATDSREPGAWLIYPNINSPLAFRPTLWTIEGEQKVEGRLAQAMAIPDVTQREKTLDEVIGLMATDYLMPEWLDLERLASQLGHLPLVTLDLWRRFARSGKAMATLMIRFSNLPYRFIDHFASELPFAWETVSFASWRNAISNLHRQCETSYGVAAETVFRSHLDSRIDDLTALHPALNYLLGCARAATVKEKSKEIEVLRQYGSMAGNMLFIGDESPLQQLLRNHADRDGCTVEWPNFFNARIKEARSHPVYASFLCKQSFGFHDGIINLPVLLATQSAKEDIQEWFINSGLIYELRRHIAFDPDWFAEAFNVSIARCLAAGLLDYEGHDAPLFF